MTTNSDLDSIFTAAIAGWHRRLTCESRTSTGDRCRRPAAWRINLHGCEAANLCGQHKAAWLRRHQSFTGQPRCVHCGVVFATLSDACTVSAL
ncbi:hypothetical protein [Mycobacterium sp. 141]|uniref:hypothetical protein n=1 Tax=Mycobacterium sp. 141 TaxID=1120797 RepID=UPI0003799477|nr:hypothetical protein [Mycobacterium sp. 141]